MTKLKNEAHVRKAKIADIEQLTTLRKLLLNEGSGHYVAINTDDQFAWQLSYKKWLIENLDHNPAIHVIVSCHDEIQEKIMGCAIGIIDQRVPLKGCLNGKMGWVQTMVVHPDFRKKGIAEQLMHYLFQWFEQNDIKKIALQSTNMATPFYEKIGFQDSKELLLIKSLHY